MSAFVLGALPFDLPLSFSLRKRLPFFAGLQPEAYYSRYDEYDCYSCIFYSIAAGCCKIILQDEYLYELDVWWYFALVFCTRYTYADTPRVCAQYAGHEHVD